MPGKPLIRKPIIERLKLEKKFAERIGSGQEVKFNLRQQKNLLPASTTNYHSKNNITIVNAWLQKLGGNATFRYEDYTNLDKKIKNRNTLLHPKTRYNIKKKLLQIQSNNLEISNLFKECIESYDGRIERTLLDKDYCKGDYRDKLLVPKSYVEKIQKQYTAELIKKVKLVVRSQDYRNGVSEINNYISEFKKQLISTLRIKTA